MSLGRFAVTGGRDYNDHQAVYVALARNTIGGDGWTLVHGDALGLDTTAAEMWAQWGNRTEEHQADWANHGKAAGPIRNQEMVDSGLDFLIAFPGGRGTADMKERCRKAGVPIIEVTGD